MTDSIGPAPKRMTPTAQRPLLGLTVLVVEDSRYASEAIRLMCLRSGARIRRADSLRAARRHLGAYRPSVAIVDLGLPDGSGEELLSELSNGSEPVAALIATSGDPSTEAAARAAGAQAFLGKPVENLGVFQETVLELLPPEARPKGPRLLTTDPVRPDPLAFQDDMAHVSELISETTPRPETLDYIAQFLQTLSRSARDDGLADAASALVNGGRDDAGRSQGLSKLRSLIQQRLAHRAVV